MTNKVVSAATRVARRAIRRGDRHIFLSPQEGHGFGNYLYFWLRAHARQTAGRQYWALYAPGMDPWLDLLPDVRRDLVMMPSELKLTDQREFEEYALFGTSFTREELHAFIRRYVIGSRLVGEPGDDETLTVNVRRGDYYSDPDVRGRYGFDIAGYLEVGLPRAFKDNSAVSRIQVISDGIEWCRIKLHPLLSRYARVEYVSRGEGAAADFARVSSAKRLIGTNSTFTYWGGYISNVLYGEGSYVMMPDFHARAWYDSRAHQADPRWVMVSDIPGGWDA